MANVCNVTEDFYCFSTGSGKMRVGGGGGSIYLLAALLVAGEKKEFILWLTDAMCTSLVRKLSWTGFETCSVHISLQWY